MDAFVFGECLPRPYTSHHASPPYVVCIIQTYNISRRRLVHPAISILTACICKSRPRDVMTENWNRQLKYKYMHRLINRRVDDFIQGTLINTIQRDICSKRRMQNTERQPFKKIAPLVQERIEKGLAMFKAGAFAILAVEPNIATVIVQSQTHPDSCTFTGTCVFRRSV